MQAGPAHGAVGGPTPLQDRPSHSPPPRPAAAAPGADAPRPAGRRLLVLVPLLVGVMLRLFQYAVNRSIWLDEALLVVNVLPRTWAGLLQPLHPVQTAPLGFLVLLKALATVFGPSELVLRLAPLLAGLATLALLPRVARRYVSRPALPFAVALVALAPYLVYYSSEVKQYAFDALVSTAILGVALALARRPRNGRLAAAFLALGAVAVWFSQPAVFMLAGTGGVLGIRAIRRRDGAAFRLLAMAAAAWLVSFAGSFLVSRHEVSDPVYMRAFWHDGFLPLPPRTLDDWLWLPRAVVNAFREPMGIIGTDESIVSPIGWVAAVIVFAAGVLRMRRTARLKLALLLAPGGLALLAAMAHQYPFGGRYLTGGRVLVFLIPSLAFVMAEGAAWLVGLAPERTRVAAAAVLAAALFLPHVAYAALSVPHVRAEVKPLLAYAEEHRQPGDVLYVYYNGASAWVYYRDRYPWPARDVVAGTCNRFQPVRYLADIDRLRGHARVWLLFSGGKAVDGFDERALMVHYLDYVGRRLDDRVAVGASLYLYDLSSVAPRPPYRVALPQFPYDVALDCRGPWEPIRP